MLTVDKPKQIKHQNSNQYQVIFTIDLGLALEVEISEYFDPSLEAIFSEIITVIGSISKLPPKWRVLSKWHPVQTKNDWNHSDDDEF